MAGAATPSMVRTVISLPADVGDDDIQSFLDDAQVAMDGCAAISGFTQARQNSIQKWLAAHFAAMSKAGQGAGGVLTQKSIGDASESYSSGQLGMNLASTRFGQTALSFDTSGCLVNIGKPPAFLENVGD